MHRAPTLLLHSAAVKCVGWESSWKFDNQAQARAVGLHLTCVLCLSVQCVVKDDEATGKRVVAGTHWDFDSYGGTIKKKLGMPAQVGCGWLSYHVTDPFSLLSSCRG